MRVCTIYIVFCVAIGYNYLDSVIWDGMRHVTIIKRFIYWPDSLRERMKERMEKHAAEQAVILIPSLEPDGRLPDYIRKLKEGGFAHIVVVDDGSGEAYIPIFNEVRSVADTVVLRHEVNKGKGVALKTGYRYIMENLPGISGVITADADGQHTVDDCLRLAAELEKGERALYLGSRDFNLECIPPKSRTGNKITSLVFQLLYGQYLPDTQTGLRAFRKEELSFMSEVEGERYEYEMKVLIACSRAGIPMIPVTIETIYENNNEGTHFHPIRDSWRIYKVIFGSIFKFMSVSMICFVIDQILALVLRKWILPTAGLARGSMMNLQISGWGARLVSSVINFMMNKNLVFQMKGKAGKPALRYALLCIAVITVSNAGVWALGKTGMADWLAKILMDTMLYFLSYRVQDRWVFKEDMPHE